MNVNLHNYNTQKIRTLHRATFKTNHEFAKKCLKYNIPHTINDTPKIVTEKVLTHSMHGFSLYVKKKYLLHKYNNNCDVRDSYICMQ